MKNAKLKVIAVDDDANARSVLRAMMTEWAAEKVEWLGEAENVPEAVRVIQKTQPDLVFLDIEMPGYSGLQLLEFFNPEDINFRIVFCTAFSEYALQAFRMSAIDYILKPVQWADVERAIDKMHTEWTKEQLINLRENLKVEKKQQKIALPVSDGFLFLPISKISYIEASGAYSEIHDAEGKKIIVSKKIKDFEEFLLDDPRFIRPHRSFIINIEFVKRYVKQEGGYLVMEDGAQVPVSREYKDKMVDILSRF